MNLALFIITVINVDVDYMEQFARNCT
jgi:hypothetical protein